MKIVAIANRDGRLSTQGSRAVRAAVILFGLAIFSAQPALATFKQQGAKLIGTGAAGKPFAGSTVAISSDGNTALVGGSSDNSGTGAAWVYTRKSGVWKQQGSKLVGTDGAGAGQGSAVALSADGNTALVGAYYDKSLTGAAWVFVRKSGVWKQQGKKLIGTGAKGPAWQGYSVSLSADGNTALIGGPFNNNGKGAVWVFVRSSGVWKQQGSPLTGTGMTGAAGLGWSVAIAGNGKTALFGGPYDRSGAGASWVFTRSGSSWKQQGGKLIGTGATGISTQGYSVALSANGNTAVAGSSNATWVFTRAGSVWKQQGNKLSGTGAVGSASQGHSVGLSSDGNMVLIGGSQDKSGVGAGWVFTRTGSVWKQHGSKLVGTGAKGAASQGYAVALSGDGNTGLLGGPHDNSGTGAAWVFFEAP